MSDLVPRLLFGSLDLTEAPYLLEFGSDFGGPETIQTAMAQLLQDGEIVSGDRSSNRELQFSILVEGSDFQAMADAEAALILEANRPRNTITWDPGDGWGPATVYDTFRATARLVRSDEMESARLRRYSLTIPALPFGRSTTLTTSALVHMGTPTVLDSCDSATGWNSAVTVDTSIYATAPASLRVIANSWMTSEDRGDGVWSYIHVDPATFTRTAPVDMTGTPYLKIKARGASAGILLRGYADGVEMERVQYTAGPNSFADHTFVCPDTSVSELKFTVPGVDKRWAPGDPMAGGAPYYIDDLRVVSASGGTDRQSSRILPVDGSVRTPGSLIVAHPVVALGDVTVFTCEDKGDGYRPDLRRWRTSADAGTADSATVSGFKNTLSAATTTVTFQVPARTLARGSYVLIARLQQGSAAATIVARVSTLVNGTLIGSEVSLPNVIVTSAAWGDVIMGTVDLPTVDLPAASSGVVQVEFERAGGDALFDEAWLYRLDNSALTRVSCGTGTPAAGGASNRLWIDSPSVDQPYGGIWVGTAADKTDARSAGPDVIALGRHTLQPPTTSVFVVTSNAPAPDVTPEHYARWHSNAGK